MLANKAKANAALGNMRNHGKDTNHFGRSTAIDNKDQLNSSAYIGPFGNNININTPGTDVAGPTSLNL